MQEDWCRCFYCNFHNNSKLKSTKHDDYSEIEGRLHLEHSDLPARPYHSRIRQRIKRALSVCVTHNFSSSITFRHYCVICNGSPNFGISSILPSIFVRSALLACVVRVHSLIFSPQIDDTMSIECIIYFIYFSSSSFFEGQNFSMLSSSLYA